jgi:hypothetical protein
MKTTLRLLTLNTNLDKTCPERVVSSVGGFSPNIVALQEVGKDLEGRVPEVFGHTSSRSSVERMCYVRDPGVHLLGIAESGDYDLARQYQIETKGCIVG